MIKVNFTDGVEVMTSSTHLYQWDSNQEITISGLNVVNASVHFTNKKRNDAIVVNGTRNNNSLVADIPNILLEDDLDIIAYVHVVASNKGNTIKVVKIPKIARQKPSDYQFTQNIEIMNFERLQSDFNDLADECHEVLDQIQRELITVDGEGAVSDGGYSIIKPRRATVNEWVNANTILANGEIAVEVPTDGVGTGISKIKIGDGTTPWNDLPYAVDNPQGAIDGLSDNVEDVNTRVDRLYNIEKLESKFEGITPTTNKQYFSYTATKRCLVNASFCLGTHTTNPKHLYIYKDTEIICALNNVNSGATGNVNVLLEKGETLKFQGVYAVEGNNKAYLNGYAQYLE